MSCEKSFLTKQKSFNKRGLEIKKPKLFVGIYQNTVFAQLGKCFFKFLSELFQTAKYNIYPYGGDYVKEILFPLQLFQTPWSKKQKLEAFVLRCHSVFMSDYFHMKLLLAIPLESIGSVCFFTLRKGVFAQTSYSFCTEHELPTHYKYLEKNSYFTP